MKTDSKPFNEGLIAGLLMGWIEALDYAGQSNAGNSPAKEELFNQANCIADKIVGHVPDVLRAEWDDHTIDGIKSALEYLSVVALI